MNLSQALRIKYGKQSGAMDEANQVFSNMVPGEFKARGRALSSQGRNRKTLKFGQRPRRSRNIGTT